jgi:hypothetical protein
LETHAHVSKKGSTAAHWLVEGALILVSVGLGFGLAEYRDYRTDRELGARVLDSLRVEVETNLATLEPFVPVHREWLKALQKAANNPPDGRSAIEVFFATRPQLPAEAKSPFGFLRRSAWEAALSGNALRLIDFDLTEGLSEVYRIQDIATANVERLANGPLTETATFDPADEQTAVRLLVLTLADIESAEEALVDAYRRRLPAIRAAAGR